MIPDVVVTAMKTMVMGRSDQGLKGVTLCIIECAIFATGFWLLSNPQFLVFGKAVCFTENIISLRNKELPLGSVRKVRLLAKRILNRTMSWKSIAVMPHTKRREIVCISTRSPPHSSSQLNYRNIWGRLYISHFYYMFLLPNRFKWLKSLWKEKPIVSKTAAIVRKLSLHVLS